MVAITPYVQVHRAGRGQGGEAMDVPFLSKPSPKLLLTPPLLRLPLDLMLAVTGRSALATYGLPSVYALVVLLLRLHCKGGV